MICPPIFEKFQVISEDSSENYVDAATISEKTGLPEFHVHHQLSNLGFSPSAYVVDLTKVWGFKRVYSTEQLDGVIKKLFEIVKYDERVALLKKLRARLTNEKD